MGERAEVPLGHKAVSVRKRAIEHVKALIRAHAAGLHERNISETRVRFHQSRKEALTSELGLLMTEGPEIDAMARRWCQLLDT